MLVFGEISGLEIKRSTYICIALNVSQKSVFVDDEHFPARMEKSNDSLTDEVILDSFNDVMVSQ